MVELSDITDNQSAGYSYLKLSQISVGTVLHVRGVDCVKEGDYVVQENPDITGDLCIPCNHGFHSLTNQVCNTDGTMLGITTPRRTTIPNHDVVILNNETVHVITVKSKIEGDTSFPVGNYVVCGSAEQKMALDFVCSLVGVDQQTYDVTAITTDRIINITKFPKIFNR